MRLGLFMYVLNNLTCFKSPLQLLVAMLDVQNFFHKALAVIFAKVQYLYLRRKLSASSIE